MIMSGTLDMRLASAHMTSPSVSYSMALLGLSLRKRPIHLPFTK